MTDAFHEVRFPLRVSLTTSGGPVRRTDIVNLSNGRESRNQRWAGSRRSYDAGSGVKSLADLYTVLEFFEARRGRLTGFRFRDPLDHASARPGQAVTAFDQLIGNGDGANRRFQLVKTYGDAAGGFTRSIAKPVSGTVKLAVGGVALASGDFTLDAASGTVTLATAPATGVAVQAGFEFDVPVRFDTDTMEVNLEAFNAGSIPSIPLVEILA
ncbi:phage distal tail protein, Rcc01695 family [Allorhizobium undicola]|uniref:phage distal tail protein, Rcc01695 family n=1 Tax=Allorhizobium undicola TaxID=78527 RepID=UPI003D33CD35